MRKVSDFKIIVFLTIMAIVVIGLVACGGNDATNPSSISQGGSGGGGSNLPTFTERTNITFITNTGTVTNENGGSSGGDSGVGDLGDNNGDTGNVWNVEQTKGKTYYGASYRGVYIFGVNPPWTRVSYNDTDRLDRIWKNMIDRRQRDGKRRMYIKTRDGDFFFDANYNIRWSKKPDTVLKWFQGGAIVLLKQGYGNNVHSSTEYGGTWSGNYTIGGLYTFAMHASQATSLNSDVVNEFFWANSTLKMSHRYGGRMEILVVHPGYPVDLGTGLFRVNGQAGTKGWSGTAYALQSYASERFTGYDDGNGNGVYNIKGNSPERYQPHMNETHQLYHLSFRWAFDKTYDPNNYPTDSAR
ncbi:hypothetical protein [Brachyspira sp.]|uniref:hypothetical protein n=1 Tax=Brachyspira sp. TaxID=1977261 RepID=UPI003D7E27D3